MLTTTDYSAIEDLIQDNYDAINNKIDSSIIYGYAYERGDKVSFNIGVSSFKALIISTYVVYSNKSNKYDSGYVFILSNNSTSGIFGDGGAYGILGARCNASVNGSTVTLITNDNSGPIPSLTYRIYYVVFT